MKKILKEFKEFAIRGNVIDMAIGVIIGGAFGKIVTSLVEDIIMPLLGIILGRVSLDKLSITVPALRPDLPPVTLPYGLFLQNVMNLLIVSASIFFVIKLINTLRSNIFKAQEPDKAPEPEPEPEPAPPEPSREESLLTEIRDILLQVSKKP